MKAGIAYWMTALDIAWYNTSPQNNLTATNEATVFYLHSENHSNGMWWFVVFQGLLFSMRDDDVEKRLLGALEFKK
jgi:hypothetical protein